MTQANISHIENRKVNPYEEDIEKIVSINNHWLAIIGG
jgi:hypothetical protein